MTRLLEEGHVINDSRSVSSKDVRDDARQVVSSLTFVAAT